MKLVIPSRKRADTIGKRSLALFPDAVVTVDEREMDDYAPVCKNLVSHPPLDTLAKIYNWIVQTFDDEIVVCIDDDILRVMCFTGKNVRVYRDPADVYQIVANAAECAKGIGAPLFGFTDSANPKNFQPQDPFEFVFNPYTVCGYVGKDILSDPNRRLFRDLDTALMALQSHRILFCDTRFHFDSVAPLRQKGGNAVVRATERLADANSFMARKWGNYVKIGRNGDTVINRGAIKRRQAKA